jgi:hypothetical protein
MTFKDVLFTFIREFDLRVKIGTMEEARHHLVLFYSVRRR